MLWTYILLLINSASATFLTQTQLDSLPQLHSPLSHLHKRRLKSFIESPEYQKIDNFIQYANPEIKQTTVGTSQVIKIKLHIDGIPIQNADRTFVYENGWKYGNIPHISQLHKRDSASTFPEIPPKARRSDISKGNASMLYQKTFLLNGVNLEPSYIVTDTSQIVTLRQKQIINIKGDIISVQDLVCRQHDGLIFPNKYAPKQKPELTKLPRTVVSNRNGNSGVTGSVFKSFNACTYYRCTGNITSCSETETVCVDDQEDREENSETINLWIQVRGTLFDLRRDWNGDGYSDGFIQLKWENAPVVASKIKLPADGVWASDIDFNTYDPADSNDGFAEVQAYYWLNIHHDRMSKLLGYNGTDGICLIGDGENCQDYWNNRKADNVTAPFPFVVNLGDIMIPNANNVGRISMVDQIKIGRGTNASNPVILKGTSPYLNAFFASSLTNDQENRSCIYDKNDAESVSCASVYEARAAQIAFGQGPKSDTALNDCTVFHELTHAIVWRFAPDLVSYSWSEYGTSADPGGLHEGWADYFASVGCGITDYRKTYNKAPGRSISNSLTCQSRICEVHVDGSIFAGGLWKVRDIAAAMGIATEFDRVVLSAMILATSHETFANQYRIILSLLKTNANERLKVLSISAEAIFNERELKCVRVTPYDEQFDTSFILISQHASAYSHGTLSNQLLLTPHASDWGVSITWTQYYLSTWLGLLDTGYAKENLVYIRSPCLMRLVELVTNGTGIVHATGCSEELLTWTDISINGNLATLALNINGGEDLYLFIGNGNPANILLSNMIMVYNGFRRIWLFTTFIIGFLNTLLFFVGFAWFIIQRFIGKKNPITDRYWKFLFAASFVLAGSGISSVLALLFIGYRYIGLGVSFGFLVWVYFFDRFQNCDTKLFQVSSCVFSTSSLIALIIIFIRQTPTAIHAIFYITFLVSWIVRSAALIQYGVEIHRSKL